MPEPRPGGGGGSGGGAADTTSPRIAPSARGNRLAPESDEPVALTLVARRGRRVMARAVGRLETAGRLTLRLKPTAAGRRPLFRSPRLGVVLEAAANDAAGNRASRRAVPRR